MFNVLHKPEKQQQQQQKKNIKKKQQKYILTKSPLTVGERGW